jgi:hypothetical protein
LRFIVGLGVILSLVGAYQGIYLLNKYLKSRLGADRRREIDEDVRRFGSCCGSPESCTLEAKLSERGDAK